MCERVGKWGGGGDRPDPKLVMPQKLDKSVYDISNDTSRCSRLYRSPPLRPLWPVSSPTVPSILSRLWATDGASLGVNY